VQLWRDIAIDRAGRIVLKLSGNKLCRRLGRVIAADPGLCVTFELVEGNADALPMRLADTLIAADKRGERDRFGCGECRIPPCSVLHRLDCLAVGILIFIGRSLSYKLFAGLWMLALAEFCEVFGGYPMAEGKAANEDSDTCEDGIEEVEGAHGAHTDEVEERPFHSQVSEWLVQTLEDSICAMLLLRFVCHKSSSKRRGALYAP